MTYIRRIVENPENNGKGIAAFPANAIWTLARIGNDEALNVLKDYQNPSNHSWVKHAIRGILLRRTNNDQGFAVLLSERILRSEPSYSSQAIISLSEGEEIRVLDRSIVNSDELGPRGGGSVFDRIEHIASGHAGYIQRAGDNFPSFI